MCDDAVKQCPDVIEFVPAHFVTQEMCNDATINSEGNVGHKCGIYGKSKKLGTNVKQYKAKLLSYRPHPK